MKKQSAFVCLSLMLMVAMISAGAQTPSPTPAPAPEANEGVHFVTDTALYQLSDGKQATVFSARFPVTPRFSGVFSQWLVPPVGGNVSLAGVEFREKLAHLVKNQSLNPELAKFEVFGRAQLGSEIDKDNKRNFAYGFEGGLEFPVGTIAGGTIKTGVRLGFLGIPYEGQHYRLGSNATVSPQVSISF